MSNQFVPRGQWIFGASASYSTHTNKDYTFLVIEDINSDGYTFKVTPLIAYAIRDNMAIGVKFIYSRSLLRIDSGSIKLGSDIDDLAYCDRQFEFGVLKRSSLPHQCRHCKYYFLCRGECPKHRFIKDSTDEYGLNILCDGYKMFFEHTEPYMQRMKALLLEKKSPSLVMEMARERLKRR